MAWLRQEKPQGGHGHPQRMSAQPHPRSGARELAGPEVGQHTRPPPQPPECTLLTVPEEGQREEGDHVGGKGAPQGIF